jgi:hypothetical protein
MKLIWKILIVFEIIVIFCFLVGYGYYEKDYMAKHKQNISCEIPKKTTCDVNFDFNKSLLVINNSEKSENNSFIK